MGHGARGCEESAEQEQADDKEPHDEDGLLHGVAVVGDEQPEGREEEREEHGKQIDEPERSLTGDAIDSPREQEADGDHEERNHPVGYQLGKDERPLRDGCDVYLFDGALLLLNHDVQRRQEAAHEHHDQREERRNHEHLVVQVLVVEEERGDLRLQGCHVGAHLGGDNLRKVGSRHAALGAVDGIGGDEDGGHLHACTRLGKCKVALKVLRDDHHHVGSARFYLLQSHLIGRFLSAKDEIATRLDAVNELL